MIKKKQENYLDYVPVVLSGNTWSVDSGKVTVHTEHRGFYAGIAQTFFHRPRISHIALDLHGSFLFQKMDGQRTVGQLAELMHERFGSDAEPLYDRLVQYMQILYHNKFIGYVKSGEKK